MSIFIFQLNPSGQASTQVVQHLSQWGSEEGGGSVVNGPVSRLESTA